MLGGGLISIKGMEPTAWQLKRSVGFRQRLLGPALGLQLARGQRYSKLWRL